MKKNILILFLIRLLDISIFVFLSITFITIMDKYKNLVRSKARSMYILGADTEDLIQEGMIGLFKAVRDYDCGRDASFYTFAELCITRQIITAIKTATRQKHIPLNSYVSLNKPLYDEESDRYLVGVELDKDAFAASESAMERDVYKPKFLEQRGWTIIRVWCRDWWLSPQKVIKSITSLAEKNRTLYKKSHTQTTPAPALEPTESVLSVVS